MKRTSITVAASLVLSMAVIIVLYQWVSDISTTYESVPVVANELVELSAVTVEEDVSASSTRLVEYTITSEETIGGIMNRVGIPPEESRKIIEKTDGVYSLSRIQVGKILKFIFAQEALASVEYPLNDDEVLVIAREGDDFVARTETVEYDLEERSVRIPITSIFYLDALNLDMSDRTIMNLVEVYSWDIDFTADISTGDWIDVTYEQRYNNGEYVGDGKVLAARANIAGQDFWAIRYTANDTDAFYDQDGAELAKSFLRTPLAFGYISSGYTQSRVNPVTRVVQPHRALDYAAPAGTPIYATANGTISLAGWKDDAYGTTVEIQHTNGYKSQYAHMSKVAAGLKKGSSVSQGDTVGYVGSSGVSTGPHLQYALFQDGTPVNPLSDDLPIGESLSGEALNDFSSVRDTRMEVLKILTE